MARMVEVLKAQYGEAKYNASRQPNWVDKTKKPTYIKCPKQGPNQCGLYCLMCAYQYTGNFLLGENEGYKTIEKNDVSLFKLIISLYLSSQSYNAYL